MPTKCPVGTIADNVGDNVGDVAGMGSDLFGSFGEASCAAMLVGASSPGLVAAGWAALMFPLTISGAGIVVCLITSFFATNFCPARACAPTSPHTAPYVLSGAPQPQPFAPQPPPPLTTEQPHAPAADAGPRGQPDHGAAAAARTVDAKPSCVFAAAAAAAQQRPPQTPAPCALSTGPPRQTPRTPAVSLGFGLPWG